MKLEKKIVAIDGNPDESISAYTDGSTWNGWLNVLLTLEQLTEYMSSSPYDMRVMLDNSVILCFEDEQTLPPPKMMDTIDGMLPLYDMNGYCFLEVD